MIRIDRGGIPDKDWNDGAIGGFRIGVRNDNVEGGVRIGVRNDNVEGGFRIETGMTVQ
jgi:hypothetical protein